MVLTNIRIWKDFVIARYSGLETKKNDFVKQSKKAQKRKDPKISSKKVAEKDSEETVLFQDSEEILTDKEQTMHQNQPHIQSYKA